MSTITTINGSDTITSSRTVINTNFSNLNTDKIETSTLDTDTTLAANSDSKIATQKAVKAYVDAGGNVNASTTSKGIVEEATVSEIGSGTASGGTGARLFVNPSSTVSTSSGAGDVGKIPRLNSSGKLDSTMLTFTNFATGTATHDISSTTPETIAHGLGVTPRFVKITTVYHYSGGVSLGFGTYKSSFKGIYLYNDTGGGGSETSGYSTVIVIYAGMGGSDSNLALGAPDSTNLNLTFSKNGTPTGTVSILWEAYE